MFHQRNLYRLITLLSFVYLCRLIACREAPDSKIGDVTEPEYLFTSEWTLSDYRSEIGDVEKPDITGWFPDDVIYDIPNETFDESRSGHPWLAVVTVGYLDIRNAPGYSAYSDEEPEDDDETTDDNESEEVNVGGISANKDKERITYRPNYVSNVTAGMERAEPFWITDNIPGESSGLRWYEISTFDGKKGFVYLPRTESYQTRTFAHEKIIPPRIVINSSESAFFDSSNAEIAPARYGDVFLCKSLENRAGIVYYKIIIPNYGNAYVPVTDCAVIAEDIFFVIYLSGSKIYDYPGQLDNLKEVLQYFDRVDWFLSEYPHSINAPSVLYRANYVALSYGAPEKAGEYRKKLIEDYPEDAKILLNPDS
ncbi:MAG: hypothetical protein GY771_01435 [bacterium]|nr:hypothetical protein [bacterium]